MSKKNIELNKKHRPLTSALHNNNNVVSEFKLNP